MRSLRIYSNVCVKLFLGTTCVVGSKSHKLLYSQYIQFFVHHVLVPIVKTYGLQNYDIFLGNFLTLFLQDNPNERKS